MPAVLHWVLHPCRGIVVNRVALVGHSYIAGVRQLLDERFLREVAVLVCAGGQEIRGMRSRRQRSDVRIVAVVDQLKTYVTVLPTHRAGQPLSALEEEPVTGPVVGIEGGNVVLAQEGFEPGITWGGRQPILIGR